MNLKGKVALVTGASRGIGLDIATKLSENGATVICTSRNQEQIQAVAEKIEKSTGKIAFGMLIGGILGNMIDRFAYQHVIDFIRFYINQRTGGEIGYPAFNIADMGICVGVGVLFIQAWREQPTAEKGRAEKGEKEK